MQRGSEVHRHRPLRIGIVGYGAVGKALARLFDLSPAGHRVVVYDKHLPEFRSDAQVEALNVCDIVFVAVPTPYDETLGRCDVSNVVDIVRRIAAPMCVKSTVPPGTIEHLTRLTTKRIAYSPEYLGESPGHPWREADSSGFVILAGDPLACDRVQMAYESSSPARLRYVRTDVRTAELAKYMENCFLATKVAFVNQFYDLARSAGVDYTALRDLFLCDPRVGESHTEVTEERGFAGKCLPKDLRSLIAWAGGPSEAPLLQSVADYNDSLKKVYHLVQ